MNAHLWTGEKSRPLQVNRRTEGVRDELFLLGSTAPAWPWIRHVGMLTGSDETGRGFTIFLANEQECARVEKWVAELTPDNRRVFIRTIVRRPEFAFVESGL